MKLVRSGKRPTDCANMLNRQRMRKNATASGGWRASSARARRARYSAISRVTSVQLARRGRARAGLADRDEAVADLPPAANPRDRRETLAVGELRVVPAGAGEIGINVEAEPDIAHDQEGRRRLVGRQVAHVALGLALGAQHVLRPAGRVADRLAVRRLGRRREQFPLWRRVGALLGFEDEAVPPVEVDPPRGLPLVGLAMRHAALEAVWAAAAARGLRPLDAEQVAELDRGKAAALVRSACSAAVQRAMNASSKGQNSQPRRLKCVPMPHR